MLKFIKDFFLYPFQKDKSENKINQLFTSLFKDYSANFWQKPTFKKIFVAPLLIIYYMFAEGPKDNEKK